MKKILRLFDGRKLQPREICLDAYNINQTKLKNSGTSTTFSRTLLESLPERQATTSSLKRSHKGFGPRWQDWRHLANIIQEVVAIRLSQLLVVRTIHRVEIDAITSRIDLLPGEMSFERQKINKPLGEVIAHQFDMEICSNR